MEIYRASPLFDQNLLFLTQEGTKKRLCLRIIPGSRTTFPHSDITEHLIHCEVTDDHDSYFLYTLDVGETDYHQLKHDQSLVVNFDVFPSKLIDLIELCVSSPPSSSSSLLSTFNVHLDTNTGILSVTETNGFKRLTHLSLHLKRGNDTAIKSYLASRLALTTSIAGRYARDLEGLGRDLEDALSELEEERQLLSRSRSILETAHTEQLSQIKMDYLTEIEQERVRHEQLVGDLRMQCQSTANDALDARQQLRELSENYNQACFRIEELASQLQNATDDQLRLGNSVTAANTEHHRLTEQNNHFRSQVANLEMKIDSLIRQVDDQTTAVAQGVALQRAGDEERQALEEKFQCLHSNMTALRESAEANSDGSALAEVLQEQVKQLGEKLQQKDDLIGQHDRLVAELQSRIEEMESCDSMEEGQEQGQRRSPSSPLSNKELSHSSTSNYALKRQVSSLQEQLTDALDRLKASDLVIAGNHDAIAYLNEEINKWQIGVKSHRTNSPTAMMSNNNIGGIRIDLQNAPATSNLLDSPCPDTLREISRNPSPFRGYPPPTIADDEIYGEGAKTANAYLQTVSRALKSSNIAYSAPSSSHSAPSPPPPLLQPTQSSVYLGSDGGEDDYDAAFSVLYPLSATEVMNRKLNRWSQTHSPTSSSSSGGGGGLLAAQNVMLLAGLADDLEALEYYKTGRNTGSKNVMAIEDDAHHHHHSHRSVKFPGNLGNNGESSGGGNSNSNSFFERNHGHQEIGCSRIPYTWQSVDLHTTME